MARLPDNYFSMSPQEQEAARQAAREGATADSGYFSDGNWVGFTNSGPSGGTGANGNSGAPSPGGPAAPVPQTPGNPNPAQRPLTDPRGGSQVPGARVPQGYQMGNLTPAQRQQWQYDPLSPGRGIANIMRQLGLPTFGPLAQFGASYASPALAATMGRSGQDFMNPNAFQNELMGRMTSDQTMNPNELIGNFRGAEDSANRALGSGADLGSLYQRYSSGDQAAGQELASLFGGDINQAIRAAYVAQLQSNPGDVADMFSNSYAAGGLSTSLSGLLGNFLGQLLQTEQNQGNASTSTRGFGFLSSLFR
jgi:hypothetical protein